MGSLIELWPLPYTDAVVASGALALGVVAGLLGTFAVLRGRSLVGDALAHAALPGVCLAFLITGAKDSASLLAGAACAGIVGAFLMVGIERTTKLKADAAIGVVLSSFFSLGIVLLTYISGRDDADQAGLERYLFGQAAGLAEGDVELMGALALASIVVVVLLFRPLKTTLFDPSFAGATGLPVRALELAMTAFLVVAVVAGLQMVGAILMVAMLVVPATAARQLVSRLGLLLPLAAVIGAAVGVTGALLSARGQVPTGPVIVLVGVGLTLFVVLVAPHRGVLWRARRLARDRARARTERALLDLLAGLTVDDERTLRALRRRGWVATDGLTTAGRSRAEAVSARRDLWSAWLEHGWELELPDAREPDPRDVAGSLGDAAAARLRELASA